MTKAKAAKIEKNIKENNKEKLIKAMKSRGFLYVHGFLTSTENEKVFKRIMDFQDDKKIRVSKAELERG